MAVTIGDHKGLVRDLRRQGWAVTQTSRGHFKAVPPKGKPGALVHFSTSSDPHAWRNAIQQLTESGYRTEREPKANGAADSTTTCPVCGGVFDEASAECLGTCGEHDPADLEGLWSALKEAKELHAVAQDDLVRAEAAVELARTELKNSSLVLQRAKKQFDKTFGE